MEEEEAHKLAALKRAYADIILNTAKEAASRILVSERKALRFQLDLSAAKEEAVNMLLRLKQTMESKMAEAERASLDQRKKIQELEAQLNEAEETVIDLRAELKQVQDEVERMKKNIAKSMDKQTVKGNADHSDLSQRNGDGPSDDLSVEHYCAGKTDLPSILMRNKEKELYRNGCNQRIRAYEKNLFTGKLSLNGQNDNGYSHVGNEGMVGDDDTVKEACTVTSSKVQLDETKDMTLPVDKSEEMVQHDSGSDKSQVVRFFRRSSRKQRVKYDHIDTTTNGASDQHKESFELSNVVPCFDALPSSQDSMTESDKKPMKLIQGVAEKDPDPHFTQISDKDCESVEGANHHPETSLKNEDPTSHFPSVRNAAENSKVSTEDIMLTRHEQKNSDTSDMSICKVNLETVNVPLTNSDSKEKPCRTAGVPSEVVNDKLLKYTFRRKRKRVPLNSHIDDSCIEKKSTSKRRTCDKQSAFPEPQKSKAIGESSRDNRRLVQVARQLISLSEKRWG